MIWNSQVGIAGAVLDTGGWRRIAPLKALIWDLIDVDVRGGRVAVVYEGDGPDGQYAVEVAVHDASSGWAVTDVPATGSASLRLSTWWTHGQRSCRA